MSSSLISSLSFLYNNCETCASLNRNLYTRIFKGIKLEWTTALTFNNCLEMGLEKFADVIIQIADDATKEFSIEHTLNKMKAEWENNRMELTPYKQTGNEFYNFLPYDKTFRQFLGLLSDNLLV